MTTKINKSRMSRDEWLETRQKGIGGSDASAVLGVNRWKSPMALYLEKAEGIREEIKGERAYWGIMLENIIADEFAKRSGKRVRRNNFIHQDKTYPFLIANVDREIVGENAGLECKTTGEFNADQWEGDNVPDNYYCQCQHYCYVMGWDGVYIAYLIGFKEFNYKYIPRDDEFISVMVKQEVNFWNNHVLLSVPPKWDGSGSSDTVLSLMFSGGNEEIKILPDDVIDDLARRYQKADEDLKAVKELKDSYKQQLQFLLGEHNVGESSRWRVSWKPVISTRIDTKKLKSESPETAEKFSYQSESRRFGLKEIKEG